MYWSWQIVSTTISDISDVIFVQKICFNVSLSISLSLFLSSDPLGPAHRRLVVNGNPSHCCGYLPGHVVTPAVHSASRWAPKIGVFLTPSLASWWKHCSPLWAKTSWQSWYKSFGWWSGHSGKSQFSWYDWTYVG